MVGGMSSMNDLAYAATAAAAAAAVLQQQEQQRQQQLQQQHGGDAGVSSGGSTSGQGSAATATAATATGASSGVSATTATGSSEVRGALIALEGLDRSGKTTQVKLLEQRFVELGRKVKVMRFPDRTTPIGQMIDGYLRSQVEMDDHVIHLLFSANRWEAVKTIASLLASGTTVICDRYYHSGIVYSAAKLNPTLSLPWARAPEVGLPRPDLVLFLDLDEAQAKLRGGWGGEVYERGEMQRRVRELFWGLSMGRVSSSMFAAPASSSPEVGGGGGGGPSATATATASDGPPGGGGAAAAVGGGGRRSREGSFAAGAGSAELRFRQEEEDLHVIDASPSVEEVAEEIWKVVRPRVEAVERGEVGRSVRKVS